MQSPSRSNSTKAAVLTAIALLLLVRHSGHHRCRFRPSSQLVCAA
jgi:hypothetical protein